MIQDIKPHKLCNAFRPEAIPRPDSPVLCFSGQQILATLLQDETVSALIFPRKSDLPEDHLLVYGFQVDDTEYYIDLSHADREEGACEKEEAYRSPSDDFSFLDIRSIRSGLSNLHAMIVFTGIHLYQWYMDTRYCGACGCRMVHDALERAMICPACSKKAYPRLMPAVIVGVLHHDRLLVTQYKTGYAHFALVAGFTEIGETLEETVAREVMEETGLRVKNIRYYKSQPWGIAQDILAGFFCEAEGDVNIRIDEQELRLAKWCTREEIVLQPDSMSLTNEMMKRFRDGDPCI